MRAPGQAVQQGAAVLLLLLVAAAAWFAVAVPLLDWHAERAEALEGRRALAVRMQQVAAGLPALARQAAAATPASTGSGSAGPATLAGATDALAGAELQTLVQGMAGRMGATLSSAELLPAEAVGGYRRVGLRIAVRATWPVLVGLMQGIMGAVPGMTVDAVQVRGSRGFLRDPAAALEASWTVLAFRPGQAT